MLPATRNDANSTARQHLVELHDPQPEHARREQPGDLLDAGVAQVEHRVASACPSRRSAGTWMSRCRQAPMTAPIARPWMPKRAAQEDGAGDDRQVVHERRHGRDGEAVVRVQDARAEGARREDRGRDQQDAGQARARSRNSRVRVAHQQHVHQRVGEDARITEQVPAIRTPMLMTELVSRQASSSLVPRQVALEHRDERRARPRRRRAPGRRCRARPWRRRRRCSRCRCRSGRR